MASRRTDIDGASPGKIFVGGLHRDTTLAVFTKYFAQYGEITDSVIMKDRQSGQPRGFGFITFADPSVVDVVIEETHTFSGKQVEIKRTIPKSSVSSKDFKTKKIFVGGVPATVTEDDFKDFFSKFGSVVEHQIVRDHVTQRSRGFGFIIFDNEQVVDEILSNGNKIDMAGTQVEIKKAEPRKSSNTPSAPALGGGRDTRTRPFNAAISGFGNPYAGSSLGEFRSNPYRNPAALGGRVGGGYVGSDIDLPGDGYTSDIGRPYFGNPPMNEGYPSRYDPYGTGLGGGYTGGAGLGGYGYGHGHGRGADGYGSYGSGSGYGGSYEMGAGYGGGAGGMYGGRPAYSGGGGGNSRYHPYGR